MNLMLDDPFEYALDKETWDELKESDFWWSNHPAFDRFTVYTSEEVLSLWNGCSNREPIKTEDMESAGMICLVENMSVHGYKRIFPKGILRRVKNKDALAILYKGCVK